MSIFTFSHSVLFLQMHCWWWYSRSAGLRSPSVAQSTQADALFSIESRFSAAVPSARSEITTEGHVRIHPIEAFLMSSNSRFYLLLAPVQSRHRATPCVSPKLPFLASQHPGSWKSVLKHLDVLLRSIRCVTMKHSNDSTVRTRGWLQKASGSHGREHIRETEVFPAGLQRPQPLPHILSLPNEIRLYLILLYSKWTTGILD